MFIGIVTTFLTGALALVPGSQAPSHVTGHHHKPHGKACVMQSYFVQEYGYTYSLHCIPVRKAR